MPCALPAVAACSPQTPTANAAPASVPVAESAPPDPPQTACWLLPAEAVSKVLGESLTTSADLGAIKYGNTSCNYYAPGMQPGEDAPRLTVTLDWNGFNLMAMSIPKAGPATAAAPHADVGDGAPLDHGVLFVRTGEHSIAMDLRGRSGLHAVATKLVAAAKSRLAQ